MAHWRSPRQAAGCPDREHARHPTPLPEPISSAAPARKRRLIRPCATAHGTRQHRSSPAVAQSQPFPTCLSIHGQTLLRSQIGPLPRRGDASFKQTAFRGVRCRSLSSPRNRSKVRPCARPWRAGSCRCERLIGRPDRVYIEFALRRRVWGLRLTLRRIRSGRAMTPSPPGRSPNIFARPIVTPDWLRFL